MVVIQRALINGLFCATVLVFACPTAAKDLIKTTDQASQDDKIGSAPHQPGSDMPVGSGSVDNDAEDVKAPAPPALSSLRIEPRPYYRRLIEKEALGTGLAPDIAESVMEVESGFNPDAVGSSGEIGLMQVMPSTARMMGFAQPMSALAQPEQNIHYGVAYLAQAWRLAGGDLCTAVMKYRAGHGETRFSSLSVDYCLAVRSKLRTRGFAVIGNVPAADFVSEGPARLRLNSERCRRGCLGGGANDHLDFASLNARLTAIVGQVRPDHE